MSLYSRLFLRDTNSPYGDVNRNSTLSFKDLDQNFLFLKERDINQLRVVGSDLIYETLGGTEYSVNIGGASSNTFVTGFTFNSPSTYDLTIEQNGGEIPLTVDLSSLASDVYVISGSYDPSTGDVDFTNSTGGTFIVSGFTTGMTDTYVTGGTLTGTNLVLEKSNGVDTSAIDLSSLSGSTPNLQQVLDEGSTATDLSTLVQISTSNQLDFTTISGDDFAYLRGDKTSGWDMQWSDGSKEAILELNTSNAYISYNGGGGAQSIFIDPTAMTVTDTINTKGLEYAADYSGAFTNESLITKRYVDSAVSGIAPTLQQVVDNGSTFTGTTESITFDHNNGSKRNQFAWNNQYWVVRVSDVGTGASGSVSLSDTASTVLWSDGSKDKTLNFNATDIKLTDTVSSKGLEYAADYGTNGKTDPRWIPDWGAVTGLTSSLSDIYVTGFTYNPTTFDLTISQNNGIADKIVSLASLSGSTPNLQQVLDVGSTASVNTETFIMYTNGTDTKELRMETGTDDLILRSNGSGYNGRLEMTNSSMSQFWSNGSGTVQINWGTDGLTLEDGISNFGSKYSSDYSTNGKLNPRWIPDWGAVTGLTSSLSGDYLPLSGGTLTGDLTIEPLTGTTNHLVESDTTGKLVQGPEVIEAYISDTIAQGLLENTSNWDINGNYTGTTTITGTYQGQSHVDNNYWFTAISDNNWIRLIRG